MVLFAAAALATPAHPGATSARVQATATIRIVEGTIVRFDGAINRGLPPPRTVRVKRADGSSEQVRLIEFQ